MAEKNVYLDGGTRIVRAMQANILGVKNRIVSADAQVTVVNANVGPKLGNIENVIVRVAHLKERSPEIPIITFFDGPDYGIDGVAAHVNRGQNVVAACKELDRVIEMLPEIVS